MSWGCAQAVVDLLQTLVPGGTRAQIAVLGAGVLGLTAATLLAPNHDVAIYADRGGFSISTYESNFRYTQRLQDWKCILEFQ